MVETELRQILDPRLFRSTGAGGPAPGGSTPPLPALPGHSPAGSPPAGPGLSQPDLLEAMAGPAETRGPPVRRSGSTSQGRNWAGRGQEAPLTREARDQRSRHRISVNARLGKPTLTPGDAGWLFKYIQHTISMIWHQLVRLETGTSIHLTSINFAQRFCLLD